MFNSLNFLTKSIVGLTLVSVIAVTTRAEIFGIGRAPTDAEVAGWDIDVRPDGLGLPPGSGSVEDGEYLYDDKCSSCHGVFGEGEARWPKLSGGFGTLADDRPEKTVGSYWPYASTLWDYIHRAMPFPTPQSLEDDEVYAITAYVLFLNEIVEEDFVLTQANLAAIEMPNVNGFYRDNRPDVKNPRCMKDCKVAADITIIESLRGITPTDHFKEDGNDGVAYVEEALEIASVDSLSERAKLGEATYTQACKVCHSSGIAGAPKLGDITQWTARANKGLETLYAHAIDGYQGDAGVMPAKGGQTMLSDDDVKKAIDFMVESSQ